MRKRYGLADQKFETLPAACEAAALAYATVDSPNSRGLSRQMLPELPFDRATNRHAGAEILGVMLEARHTAAKGQPFEMPSFIGDDGQRHLGIRA